MASKRLLVIGACGDIGQGIARGAQALGLRVIAADRSAERLAHYPAEGIPTVSGDLGSLEGAMALWDAAQAPFDGVDAVAIAVNAPNQEKPLLEWTAEEIQQVYATNLLTHFHAIKAILPRLPDDGILIGIGGGAADFILPNLAQLSMTQAAQRMMYRGFAKEWKGRAQIRELMLISMINGERKRQIAEPHWVMDTEVGQHVCAIIADTETFAGPILRLESREQVGKPEPVRQKARS
jgi:NAD(P)-dependent dehydrogenase (short-subunit alcohol dehydrogenase family)